MWSCDDFPGQEVCVCHKVLFKLSTVLEHHPVSVPHELSAVTSDETDIGMFEPLSLFLLSLWAIDSKYPLAGRELSAVERCWVWKKVQLEEQQARRYSESCGGQSRLVEKMSYYPCN